MISPNKDIVDVLNGNILSLSNDADGTALIEAGQGSEVLLGDARGKVGSNESVSVGGVADDTDLHSLFGDLVKGLTLSLENLGVGRKKISTFHTRTTGSGTNEDSNINILETNESVGGGDNLVDEGVGTIVEFHDETLEDFLSGGELNKLEDDLLVGSEHTALSDEVAEEAADSASGSSDGNSDGSGGVSGRREVSADALKSFHFVWLGDM